MTITAPAIAQQPEDGSKIVRMINEIIDEERAKEPKELRISVWDGAQQKYRKVDPNDTTDYLHTIARQIERMQAGVKPSQRKVSKKERRTTQKVMRRVAKLLPTVATGETRRMRDRIAANFVEARRAADRGDHLRAQVAAKRCIELIEKSKASTAR